MSTEISVSNNSQKNCKDLLTIMKNYGQDCRVTKTRSVVKNQFETGCIITMDSFEDKSHLVNLWKVIRKDGNYDCAYVKIDGGFSGCINNYLDEKF
jgi:hypothetical protein